MDPEPPIKATKTTFTIIETLIDLDGAGISELADNVGIPKSTVHNHLNTLNQLGYVCKDGSTYQVGTQFIRLGSQLRRNHDIYGVSKQEIKKLAESTGEHTSLMIEENGRGVYFHTVEGSTPLKVVTINGMATKLHTTAPGKAILAHLPEEERESIYDTHGLAATTSNTIVDRSELESHLEQIREQGYALDTGETLEAMRGVAAPIVHNNGSVQGAISVYGPRRRTDIDEFESSILDDILHSKNVIEVNLSY
ncbi:IclR family transcriptional regulator [Natrinema caseinilyticum]|uniref:IclR family transcriptional regulator n=1 Tax=Natrinema caseinilyticum TaxID=2961570 RepID=UPI0020C3210F|nr:IclR family transcriptional regulator [Natrinema caseinilyticum]